MGVQLIHQNGGRGADSLQGDGGTHQVLRFAQQLCCEPHRSLTQAESKAYYGRVNTMQTAQWICCEWPEPHQVGPLNDFSEMMRALRLCVVSCVVSIYWC